MTNPIHLPTTQAFIAKYSGRTLFRDRSAFDQVWRIYCFAKIADKPLFLSVGLADSDVFADWYRASLEMAGLTLLLLLFSGGVAAMLVRDSRNKEAVAHELAAKEESLRASEERLRLASEAAKQGWFDVDLKTGKVAVSPEYVGIVGHDPDEFETDLTTWLSNVHPDDRNTISAAFQECVQNGGPGSMEYRRRTKSGDWKWIHSIGKIIEWDAEKRATRMVGIHTDIAERKEAETKLLDANQRLKAQAQDLEITNAELEKFAYVASHDMRQPVRTIINYLSLIEKKLSPTFDAELTKYFGFAKTGARRMDSLIVDLLDYSRTGRNTEPLGPVPLDGVVKESLQNLASAITEAGAAIQVDNDLPTIFGYRSDLIRLMQNLISNAIKYSHPDRLPEITIGCRGENDHWLAWVRDNGMGIPLEFQERVFGIFQRLVPKEAYEGTGIGLTVCKKIVEQHGGRIWIESAPGDGSTFFFTIPTTR